jgi:predicted RNase H-like HicB family nuclease
MNKYEIIIFWSEEDQSYVADVPELPGCMAHGASYEQALKNIEEAMELWIETTIESGGSVPVPIGRRLTFA